MKNTQSKIIKLSLTLAATIVIIMALVYAYDVYFSLDLYKFGVYPRKINGLIGILTSPFIHSTINHTHLLNNSAPIFVLVWLLFLNYRKTALKVFLIVYLGTGLSVWLFGRPSYHIGMSGIIYGLTSFLAVSGFLTKNLRITGISLLVIFLYGSLIWGIFPQTSNISWEGHFFGFFIGIIMSFVYKKELPEPDKFRYEIEEELGIEPNEEYWKTDYVPNQSIFDESPDPLRVNYTIKPVNKTNTKDKDDKKSKE